MNTSKADISLQTILKDRTQKFGSFCSFADQSSDLSLLCQTQPVVDERLMSARAVINTPREDREGDVIVPRGVHLENYRNNPVVLWEHGLGELTRPIAKCQQPDGKLALDVSDHEITAASFFTDKCLESLQIFHLIAEGLVRATSVRALPIKSAIRKTSNAGSGIILEEWELIEWSWGALGVNPDAIARTLDRGTIEGQKITAPLLKSLQAVLPDDQISIPGWSTANKTNIEISRSSNSTASQQPHHPPLSDSPKEAQSISFKSASNEICESEIEVKDKKQRIPLGAQLLRFISDSITLLTEQVNSTEAILENERIQQRLKSFLQALQDEQDDLSQLYQNVYKHLPSLSNSEHSPQSPDSIKSPYNSEFPLLFKETQLNRFTNRLGSPQLQNCKTLTGPNDQRQLMDEILKEIKLQNDAQVSISTQRLEGHVEALSKPLVVLQRKICDLLPAQKK